MIKFILADSKLNKLLAAVENGKNILVDDAKTVVKESQQAFFGNAVYATV